MYVYKIWLFFDHLPPSVYIFYGIKVYKNSIFLTTYPPSLVNVVCERPLIVIPNDFCGGMYDFFVLRFFVKSAIWAMEQCGMKSFLKLQFFITGGNFHLFLLQKELKNGLSYEDEKNTFWDFSTFNRYAILQYIHSKTKKALCKRRFMKVDMRRQIWFHPVVVGIP